MIRLAAVVELIHAPRWFDDIIDDADTRTAFLR
jgi:geranylgeranyl pyrophosphate synthase